MFRHLSIREGFLVALLIIVALAWAVDHFAVAGIAKAVADEPHIYTQEELREMRLEWERYCVAHPEIFQQPKE